MIGSHWQPFVNACLNLTSAVLVVLGFTFIRRGRVEAHRKAMLAAVGCSVLFLISYVIYHYTAGSVKYQGTGSLRAVYFAILISHTILAVAVVPLVVTTLTYALKSRFNRHRRWARRTFPVWIYVSITGVVVYLMLYH
jgi:uncharacterized membrane protein YozB (DUF420 family)